LETGRLTLVTDAMAREITLDARGRADGVLYIDKRTRTEQRVEARVVVLAASACESARILLNSKSARFPDGLANSSGTVGKYLTDTTGTDVGGFIPRMVDHVVHNEDGTGGMHLYMPWWLDNRKLDFPRGYHIEFGGGQRVPMFGFMSGIHRYNGYQREGGGGGYGRQLKEDYRSFYGAFIGFAGRGEMVAQKSNYCEIDPNVVDRYGIPVLRFHVKWSDYEYQQVKHMQETFRIIIDELGGIPTTPMPGKEEGYGIDPPGFIIHELGVTRMGDDPRESVVNGFCQAHDVKNLFVADGGPFVS